MDVKQIIERGKNVSKAMSDDEPASSFLKILGDLRNVRATEDLLRQTKIGVTINRLRTYKYPEVAKLSQELITKWKNEVNNAKKKANTQGKVAGSGTPNSAAAVGSSAPPSGTASPAPQAAGKKTHSVDPASRNDKTDKVNTTIFGIPARDNCIKLMYNGLAFMSEELPEAILPVARDVENAAWIQAGSTNNDAYRQKMRSLFQNLKNKSNPALRKRVQSGEISPKRFVEMSHDEMKSETRKAEDALLEKQNMNEAMAGVVEKSISKEFVCGRCKKREVSYSQAQTRSADEPMTTFCECMNCGNRWKFS